jgi:hypothetical protein
VAPADELMTVVPGSTLLGRIGAALQMDGAFYRRVGQERMLNREALGIMVCVVLVGVTAHALAIDVDWITRAWSIGLGVVVSLVSWVLVSGWLLLLGRKLFGGTGSWGGMCRGLAYAQIPLLLNAFDEVAAFKPWGTFFGTVFVIPLVTVAVREIMEIRTIRAVGTVLAAFGPIALLSAIVVLLR